MTDWLDVVQKVATTAQEVVDVASKFLGKSETTDPTGQSTAAGAAKIVQVPGSRGGIMLWLSASGRFTFNAQPVTMDTVYDEAQDMGTLLTRAHGFLMPKDHKGPPRLILTPVVNPDLAAALVAGFYQKAGIAGQLPAVDCAFWAQLYAVKPPFAAEEIALGPENQPNAQLAGLAAGCRNPVVIWVYCLNEHAVTDQPPQDALMIGLWVAHPEHLATGAPTGAGTGATAAPGGSGAGVFLGLGGGTAALLLAALAARR